MCIFGYVARHFGPNIAGTDNTNDEAARNVSAPSKQSTAVSSSATELQNGATDAHEGGVAPATSIHL